MTPLDEFGMTLEQMYTHVALGDVPHAGAPADVCGATDPRDGAYWCIRPRGHGGHHNRYVADWDEDA